MEANTAPKDGPRGPMEVVIIPGRSVLHVKGVPVTLAVDTLVEVAHGNMALLIGNHYAHLPAAFLPEP